MEVVDGCVTAVVGVSQTTWVSYSCRGCVIAQVTPTFTPIHIHPITHIITPTWNSLSIRSCPPLTPSYFLFESFLNYIFSKLYNYIIELYSGECSSMVILNKKSIPGSSIRKYFFGSGHHVLSSGEAVGCFLKNL